MQLPPWAFAQLAAYRELQDPDLCKSCRREAMQSVVERACEQCGRTYQDPQVLQALETL